MTEADRRNSRPISVRLRSHADHLKARGVVGLWIFGSVARGEAGLGSDVDLLAEFDPTVSISLVTIASLRAELSDCLGIAVDLVERDSLRPVVKAMAERDAVRVF